MATRWRSAWLAPAATALSLLACYGTLAATAALGALGVSIGLSESAWAGTIVVFAWLALLVLCAGWRRHRAMRPMAIAGIGVVIITLTILVAYDRVLELIGFAFLCAGTFLDWRARSGEGRVRR